MRMPFTTLHLLRSLLIFSVAVFSGCVSVHLGGDKPSQAQGVQLTPPGSPFNLIKDKELIADQTWQSSVTGGMISYLSECPETGMELEALTNEALSVLKSGKIEKQDESFFNGREALSTWASGKMDGIAMKMHSMAFKKNGCSYLVTYVTRSENFSREEEHFSRFLQGFKAP